MQSRLIDAALQLLPRTDQAAVLQLNLELYKWLEVCHSSPMATNSAVTTAGRMPYWLGFLCLFTCVGACMRAAAFEQLSGERALHDWSAAEEVRLEHDLLV